MLHPLQILYVDGASMSHAQQLFRERYGDDSLPAPGAWSPIIEHLLAHSSDRT